MDLLIIASSAGISRLRFQYLPDKNCFPDKADRIFQHKCRDGSDIWAWGNGPV